MFKKLILSTALFSTLLLQACGLETYKNGDLPSQKRLSMIEKGAKQDFVINILGTPAFKNTIGDDDFYIYSEITKESRAFLAPKETNRQLYVISFDNDKKVSDITYLTLKDGQKIEYDPETTVVSYKNLSIMEQLAKNFGRYDAGGNDSANRQ